jgi:hypothetical protein|tara:strand:+ start:1149 stop:1610 length:462 start_codon:yes stop_codon:yes gene_type:complete
MQITYLSYFLASIIAYLGLIVGIILIKLAPEEQKPGKKYFILIKKIIFLLVMAFYLFFYRFNPTLSVIFLAITFVLMMNKKLKLEKTGLTYFLFGIVFYASSKIPDLFVMESVLIFLYGIPAASLILKKKNYYGIFLKNFWFFIPVILLYFAF